MAVAEAEAEAGKPSALCHSANACRAFLLFQVLLC